MAEAFNIEVKFEDNSGKVLAELSEATERALYAMGIKAVEGSVDAISGKYTIDPAVDTGRLRASISFITPTERGEAQVATPENAKDGDVLKGKAEAKTVIIGSNVEYASYVHNGTSKREGRPFLREGIERTKDKMKEQVEKIYKGEL